MELGSAVLGDIWQLEIAQDATGVERAARELHARLARLEPELAAGPYFAGSRFHLVDAVFAPAFRYFDVFDELAGLGVFDALPRVRAWRAALALRPSVRDAVPADYPERLRMFLDSKSAYLWTHRAGRSHRP
jgi:glutathione S-transferase